jgi:hypothetical protein
MYGIITGLAFAVIIMIVKKWLKDIRNAIHRKDWQEVYIQRQPEPRTKAPTRRPGGYQPEALDDNIKPAPPQGGTGESE